MPGPILKRQLARHDLHCSREPVSAFDEVVTRLAGSTSSVGSARKLAPEPDRGVRTVTPRRAPRHDFRRCGRSENGQVDYIKRVVGLPGDRIQMKQGLLYINGTPVARERLTDFVGEEPCGSDAVTKTRRWRETLPNGVSYETLDCVDNGFYDNTNVYTVPDGHFFMMGDNRDNSTDSRVLSAIGYIPLENIIGRAGLIFFSRSPGSTTAAPAVRSERIGVVVH